MDSIRLKEGVSIVLRKKSAKSHEILEVPAEVRVELGLSDGKKTEIVSGLEEGDIIMTPEFRLEGEQRGEFAIFTYGKSPEKQIKKTSDSMLELVELKRNIRWVKPPCLLFVVSH